MNGYTNLKLSIISLSGSLLDYSEDKFTILYKNGFLDRLKKTTTTQHSTLSRVRILEFTHLTIILLVMKQEDKTKQFIRS